MTLSGRWMQGLWLVGCLALGGCRKEEPAAPPTPRAPTPSAPAPSAPAPAQASPPGPAAPPEDAGAPAPTPGDTAAAPTGSVPPEDPRHREWTAGNLALPRALPRPVTLRAVRSARNEGFDRVVFEFEGEQLPGYHLEYIDKPVRKCGSGDATEVAGEGWLQVRLTPAQAHADGQVTVAEREQKPGLPVVRELELTCDFEGEVTWVLGNQRPQKYRVLELRAPTRLVVDVQH